MKPITAIDSAPVEEFVVVPRELNTEEQLVLSILEHPADDAPRLIFADYLEEQGKDRQAQFLREPGNWHIDNTLLTWQAITKVRSFTIDISELPFRRICCYCAKASAFLLHFPTTDQWVRMQHWFLLLRRSLANPDMEDITL
jgi:uncharacterized protein (TIGR02996 family)